MQPSEALWLMLTRPGLHVQEAWATGKGQEGDLSVRVAGLCHTHRALLGPHNHPPRRRCHPFPISQMRQLWLSEGPWFAGSHSQCGWVE